MHGSEGVAWLLLERSPVTGTSAVSYRHALCVFHSQRRFHVVAAIVSKVFVFTDVEWLPKGLASSM